MVYTYAQPNLSGGIDDSIVEVATAVPSFIVGLLLFVWAFVFITGSRLQKAGGGFSDTPMWSVMASLSTLMIALLMTLREGLINTATLGIVVAITILSGVWLYMSRMRGDQ